MLFVQGPVQDLKSWIKPTFGQVTLPTATILKLKLQVNAANYVLQQLDVHPGLSFLMIPHCTAS